jgi:hypothetical protein
VEGSPSEPQTPTSLPTGAARDTSTPLPDFHRKNPPPVELMPSLDTQKKVPAGVYIRQDGIHPGKPLPRHKKKKATTQPPKPPRRQPQREKPQEKIYRKKVLFYLPWISPTDHYEMTTLA